MLLSQARRHSEYGAGPGSHLKIDTGPGSHSKINTRPGSCYKKLIRAREPFEIGTLLRSCSKLMQGLGAIQSTAQDPGPRPPVLQGSQLGGQSHRDWQLSHGGWGCGDVW